MFILYSIMTVLVITGIIVAYNYFTAPVLRVLRGTKPSEGLISVLIPARNEENNISNCLQSLTMQDYMNLEILVLDDNSEDGTFTAAAEFAEKDERIRIIKGEPLPAGFTGKNWACHQLSQSASGEHLLFIDADVTLEKNSITSAIGEFKKYNLDLLSVSPTQKINSSGEWLTVPLLNWVLLSFLPLQFVYSHKSHSLAAANGQFMFFKRSAYESTGGHHSLRSSIAEDLAFARRLKQNGFRVKTYLGGEFVYCRMYKDFRNSFEGFTKNFFPGSGLSRVIFISLISFLTFCFTFPFIMVFIDKIFILPLMLIILQRILISARSRQHVLINLLFHPFQMIMFFILGINSVAASMNKRRRWKGRIL